MNVQYHEIPSRINYLNSCKTCEVLLFIKIFDMIHIYYIIMYTVMYVRCVEKFEGSQDNFSTYQGLS
jgi:hypothetical protein